MARRENTDIARRYDVSTSLVGTSKIKKRKNIKLIFYSVEEQIFC